MRVLFIRIYNGDVGVWTFFPGLETEKKSTDKKKN